MKENKNITKNIIRIIFYTIVGGFMLWNVYSSETAKTNKEIPYTEFINKIKKGEFKKIEEKGTQLYATEKDVVYYAEKLTDRAGQDNNFVNAVNSSNAEVKAEKVEEGINFLSLFFNLIQIGLIFYFFSRSTGKVFGSTGNKINSEKVETKFSDVAGIDEVKEELMEVVDFLKTPERFLQTGARAPKGVLLLGNPGTGKTLLAKAVAGESNANFFTMSGSEFVEMYVGVGAARVRDLFKKAKTDSPSIIFIDEIDAVGGKRSSGPNRSDSEREQTLNQLLVEMDGFDTDSKVIVMAATNREDMLDSALLRAGRFDRKINVTPPDLKGRTEILAIHSKNKKLSSDVSLEAIAKITAGFVGADLANLVNEAAILASRKNSSEITMEDFDDAIDKIGLGLGKKGRIIKPQEKKLLAYHEAGHALMAELLEDADPVHKVTIVSRGSAGGFMMPLPEEKLVTTSKELIAQIKVLFGGRASEEIVFNDISTGAYSDIKKATEIARTYIEKVGMNNNIGPVNIENENYYSSDITMREVDLEIREMLGKEYRQTIEILKENREKLDKIAGLLVEKETITGEEVRKIVNLERKEEKIEQGNI
jgi:ATP-dependent zinc metalloprotease ftsH